MTEMIPFGEGGAELNMTRAEMIEHARAREEEQQAIIDSQTQLVFAWLLAMYFVGRRLNRFQFAVISFFFTLLTFNKWLNLHFLIDSAQRWWTYAGASAMDFAAHGEGMEAGLTTALSGWLIGGLAFLLWACCMWWGISCYRGSGPSLRLSDVVESADEGQSQ